MPTKLPRTREQGSYQNDTAQSVRRNCAGHKEGNHRILVRMHLSRWAMSKVKKQEGSVEEKMVGCCSTIVEG